MLLETQLKDVMTSEDREVRLPIGWVLVYDEQLGFHVKAYISHPIFLSNRNGEAKS